MTTLKYSRLDVSSTLNSVAIELVVPFPFFPRTFPNSPPLFFRFHFVFPVPHAANTFPLCSLAPSPLLLIYHFFSVALYSLFVLFTSPRAGEKSRPSVLEYPALTIKSAQVFWAACVVLLPVLWSEGQM